MKINNYLKTIALGLAVTVYAACTNTQKNELAQNIKATPTDTKAKNLFPFYKSIEIKPGYNFEVVSWGKGVDTLGGYLILMSDSIKNNYKTLSAEREGIITDAWNMDLDNDGNPEIYIQYKVRKNVNDLKVYEFVGNNFEKISFPGLKESFKKTYKGDDTFFVKNGELLRSVPLVQTDSGKTITLVKTLQYSLRGNSFSSQEVTSNP